MKVKGTRRRPMFKVSPRHAHFVFGAMQSCVTSLAASGIASREFWDSGAFLHGWMQSWLMSWIVILPVVLLFAPVLRSAVAWMTREPGAPPKA